MNKLFLCFLFSIASFAGFSQKIYFIYLQTDDSQPFYVKMDKKVYSSSASGYLILSKLRDTAYSFAIGFPKSKSPEQLFSVSINQKDHGYLVKNFGEKGWGLFDLQALTVQMANSGTSKLDNRQVEENANVSVFTAILSKAADDPTLRERPVQIAEPEKSTGTAMQETVKQEDTKPQPADTIVFKPAEVQIQESEKKEEPAMKEEQVVFIEPAPYQKSVITKKSESSTTEGFGLVFVDDLGDGTNDTIRLLIPNPKPVVIAVKEEVKEEKRFLDILPDSAGNIEVRTEVQQDSVEKRGVKNNCTLIAEESDFFKLRKIMAAAEGDDNMIAESANYSKAKCFTTQQIKNLGLLFLTDGGKLKFFAAAYGFVSDKEKFSQLESELKEEEYVNRFKALLRK